MTNELIRNQPQAIFIEIGTECNSRCKYCLMWLTEESPGGLTISEKIDIIEQFKQMSPSGEVVLTGGETMLKYGEFFALSSKCRDLGLACAANTNASLIDDDNIERLLAHGPKYLVISLDSLSEQQHDFGRGVVGSYKQAVRAINKLVSLKKQCSYRTEIITNSVIYNENIGQMKDFVLFAEELGLDGIMFQLLSRTFYKKGERDHFFEDYFFKDKEAAKRQIQDVIGMLDTHPIIRTDRQDLEWMKLYIDSPDFIGEPVCGSYERNIMIDSRGEARLCFDMKKIAGALTLGNVREKKLRDIWTSSEADKIRSIMIDCRLNCGMLNCHRKK